MFLKRAVVVLVCLAAGASSCASNGEGAESRPGTVRHTLSLSDGVGVTLDAVMVERVMGSYLFVRDPWPKSELLPVYAPIEASSSSESLRLSLPEGLRMLSVEVTGRTMTVGGKRIVAASRIRLYVNSNGRPTPPLPKSPLSALSWRYMVDLPLETTDSSSIPSPPELANSPPENPELDAPANSISGAKLADDQSTVACIDKIVTAVFRDPETQEIEYFYIEEPDRSSGIKVVPQSSVSVKRTDVVTIQGTVFSGAATGECYISASQVEVNGCALLPKPLGMPQRSTAGGSFGLQPALSVNTESNPAIVGSGLNPVGLRVRLWGRVTEVIDAQTYLIDDGSGLVRGENPGTKIAYHGALHPTYQVADYVAGVTGVLGAELANGHPAPVLRVDNPQVICVRPQPDGDDGNNGLNWTTAKATVQAAIDAAASAGGPWEVWVAQGRYYGPVTLRPDVAVYGGFTGVETEKEQRNWLAHETILSLNAGSVTSDSTAEGPAVIDGFTIRGGFLGVQPTALGANITISHNTIRDNVWGIDIESADSSSNIRIIDNWITSNYAGGVQCNWCWDCPGVVIANNTITSNAHWETPKDGIVLQVSSPVIANNIIAFNACGISTEGQLSNPTFEHNCMYENTENYCNFTPLPNSGNIIADPLLLGVHIHPTSPCRNAGENSYVEPCETDIDNQPRILDVTVDIGADESNGCPWGALSLELEGICFTPGEPVTITAKMRDALNQPIEGCPVRFSATAPCQVTLTPESGMTGPDGNAQTVLVCPCEGTVVVTATAQQPCGGVVSAQTQVGFSYPNNPGVYLFFCIDVTGSMHYGGYPAEPSIEALLEDLDAELAVPIVAGGIKFNGNNGMIDVIDMADPWQFHPVWQFTTLSAFIDWVNHDSGLWGGDLGELALDALHHAAGQVSTLCGTPQAYIVLVTDVWYHENDSSSPFTKQQIIDELTSAGCPVYISLWDEYPYDPPHCYLRDWYYLDLNANGGEFDEADYTPNATIKYPFARLRARILGN